MVFRGSHAVFTTTLGSANEVGVPVDLGHTKDIPPGFAGLLLLSLVVPISRIWLIMTAALSAKAFHTTTSLCFKIKLCSDKCYGAKHGGGVCKLTEVIGNTWICGNRSLSH